MPKVRRPRLATAVAAAAALAAAAPELSGQAAPNPYRPVAWGELPDGREWGPLNGIYADPDGLHIWFADRCGRTPSRSARRRAVSSSPTWRRS